MSGMKEIMVKGMNKVMMDCEQATMASTRNDLEPLGFMKRLQLRMHLMGCKFCREFAKQSKQVNGELDQMKEIDPQNLKVHLAHDQKERLNETIEQNI
jgi:hypothetical protein